MSQRRGGRPGTERRKKRVDTGGARLPVEPPSDLRAASFRLGDDLVVLSFPGGQEPQRVELTAAEREVLLALLAGHSNRDIARERGRSVRTVANQVASLYRKLGVTSRGELAARHAWYAPGDDDA